MNENELLAFCYDYYNEHMLNDQNDDIEYYKNVINEYNPESILVVGSGTGRVAIPLSEHRILEVLDIDLERLKRLQNKKDLVYYNMDFCEKHPPNKYSMIIVPYSTLQCLSSYEKIEKFIQNAYQTLVKNGILLIDVSESFNTKESVYDLLLFEDYSKEIESSVICRLNSKRNDDYIEFDTEFIVEKYNCSIHEKEKYLYFDNNRLSKIMSKYFQIIKMDSGYGKNKFLHKHIYHLRGI